MALGCPVGVSCYDCVSVHCGAREGWKRSRDMYIRSRHAPAGQVRFDILSVDPVADVGAQPLQRFIRCYYGEQFRHKKSLQTWCVYLLR